MSHSNTKSYAEMVNSMQLVDRASAHQFLSAASSYHTADRASSTQSSFHLNDKTNEANNSSKIEDHDSTKNEGSRFKKQGNRHQNRHNFVNLNQYKDISGVIEVAFNHQQLSNRNMSAVWHRLSKIITDSGYFQKQHQERYRCQLCHKLNTLLSLTINGLKEYGPIQLSQTALSMAKIIKAVRFCGKGQDLKYHQMFRDLLIGRDAERKESLFQKIASAAVPLLQKFDPQGYSNLVYACAIAGVNPMLKGRTVFECVADAIIALGDLGSFYPLHLSNILWAYATAKVFHHHLFDKIAYEVIASRDLRHFNPQLLTNIVWAYASAKISHHGLFDKVAYEVIEYRDLGYFKPQTLSNILWAYATARVSCPLLFKKVADKVVACKHLGVFKPQDLSNIVWAFATAQVPNDTLFDKVADEVISRHRLLSFNSQNLSNILWAYVTAKASRPRMFKKVAEEVFAYHDLKSFNSQAVSNILWAYATSGFVKSSLFTSMASRVVALLHKCNSQDITNIAWSYAVANVDAPVLFNSSFIDSILERMESFGVAGLRQLYQWHLWQKEENSNTGLPLVFEKRCKEAFTSAEPKVSALQKDVVACLCSIGLKPKQEELTERGYRLDALVKVNGKEVGVEVDGPSHFIDRIPTGNTMLKQRQITTVEGIALVSVPYFVWNDLGQDFNKKQNYLRSLLYQ